MRIDRRFCGPPGIANGGYVAGRVASELGGAVEVTLRAPTPPDTELVLGQTHERAELRTLAGTLLVEAASVAGFDLPVPDSVSFEQAVEASKKFVGFQRHPYPSCFVCGTARPAELGAGLALFPGAVDASENVVAAPFVPALELCDAQGLLGSEFVWAALDCPSWFGHAAFSKSAAKILLGRLTVQVHRRPAAHERCVVHGFSLGQEGRRIQCGSALTGADGALIAYAKATWVELKDA